MLFCGGPLVRGPYHNHNLIILIFFFAKAPLMSLLAWEFWDNNRIMLAIILALWKFKFLNYSFLINCSVGYMASCFKLEAVDFILIFHVFEFWKFLYFY